MEDEGNSSPWKDTEWAETVHSLQMMLVYTPSRSHGAREEGWMGTLTEDVAFHTDKHWGLVVLVPAVDDIAAGLEYGMHSGEEAADMLGEEELEVEQIEPEVVLGIEMIDQ